MKPAKALKKIIWSIDPFEHPKETLDPVQIALKTLSAVASIPIEAVSVLSPHQMDLGIPAGKIWAKDLRPAVEKAIRHTIKNSDVKNVSGIHVLLQNRQSISSMAKALAAHAKAAQGGLIVLGSHGRKGLDRFFLGSFAESLLLQNKVPLLISRPDQRPLKNIRTILYPTDLSARSLKTCRLVLGFAHQYGAKVKILHSITHPSEALLQSGAWLLAGSWVEWPDFLREQEIRARKLGEKLVEIGKSMGVAVELKIQSHSSGVLSDIVAAAKDSSIDLIAMEAQSGAAKSALAGSITRQIVRAAPCPVWVYRV